MTLSSFGRCDHFKKLSTSKENYSSFFLHGLIQTLALTPFPDPKEAIILKYMLIADGRSYRIKRSIKSIPVLLETLGTLPSTSTV